MAQICEWQFMQVLVGGMPAKADVSTDGVAIAAVDAVVADVVQVAELNRLLDVFLGARHVGRAAEHHDEPDEAPAQEEKTDKTDLGEGIGAAMEDLRHRC